MNLNDDIESKSIFEGNIDAETIIKRLKLKFNDKEIEPGKTLIFLDEIQECTEAYSSLKSFTDSGKYDVIASGSLLGVKIPCLNNKNPAPLIPLGYEEHITMYSLDFEEFLWAKNISSEIIEEVRLNVKTKTPIDPFVLKTFETLFRDFMIVGSMPEAVQTFVDTDNYKQTGKVLSDIIVSCKKDIRRYNSGMNKIKTENCFDSIPAQLRESNKKYMFSRIEGEGSRKSSEKYMENLLWIKGAGYGNFCYGLEQPASPIMSNVKKDSFKVYLSDTGMLMHMYGPNTMKAIYENDISYNMGAITENVVMECLKKDGFDPYYYEKKKGDNKMELDFVIEGTKGIVAIEVKSGKERNAPSIEKSSKVFDIARKIKLENSNISVDENGIEHYPLFVSAFFKETEPEWNGPEF